MRCDVMPSSDPECRTSQLYCEARKVDKSGGKPVASAPGCTSLRKTENFEEHPCFEEKCSDFEEVSSKFKEKSLIFLKETSSKSEEFSL
ncbi:DNA-directed RNA polymerase subunit beta', partial [Frankliniella fusca]